MTNFVKVNVLHNDADDNADLLRELKRCVEHMLAGHSVDQTHTVTSILVDTPQDLLKTIKVLVDDSYFAGVDFEVRYL